MPEQYGIDRKTFVWYWTTSSSAAEVLEKLTEFARGHGLKAMPYSVMLARAAELRSEGVTLQKFKPGPKRATASVDELNRYIEELRRGTAKSPEPPELVARPPATADESVLDFVKRVLAENEAAKAAGKDTGTVIDAIKRLAGGHSDP